MKYSKYKIHYCIFCQVKSQILNRNIFSKISDILNLAQQEVNGSNTSLAKKPAVRSITSLEPHIPNNPENTEDANISANMQIYQWLFKYIDL